MNNLETTGLNAGTSKAISEKLNLLLADYHLFYMNTRGFHWNIKGSKFFMLHAKFEEIYDDLAEKIDEVAERILMLGNTPLHSFTEYLKLSTIKEQTNISDEQGTVKSTLESLKTVLKLEREILALAAESNDEATVSLMSDFIAGQEKLAWMLNSYLA
jgi:starvation-inducible DNA-binding protein